MVWRGPSSDAKARKVAAMAVGMGGEGMMGDGWGGDDERWV